MTASDGSRPTLQLFTLCLEYAATGEGMRQELMVCRAVHEAQARQLFYPGDARVQAYFNHGLTVSVGIDHAVLERWLSSPFIDLLERTVAYGDAFYLHHDFSFS